MSINKESILAGIDTKTQALKDAIGEELSAQCGFQFSVDGLDIKAVSDRFGITVENWQSKDGPQWQIFQSWTTEWEPQYIRICGLRTVRQINHYESSTTNLREILRSMAARVEAYLELHPKPKPVSLFDRMRRWIS